MPKALAWDIGGGQPEMLCWGRAIVWLRVGYLCWDGRGLIQEVEGGAPGKG